MKHVNHKPPNAKDLMKSQINIIPTFPFNFSFASEENLFSYHLLILRITIYDSLAYFGIRQWHPTPVLLPGKSHGWRSLEGCSPWGR